MISSFSGFFYFHSANVFCSVSITSATDVFCTKATIADKTAAIADKTPTIADKDNKLAHKTPKSKLVLL